MSFELKKWVQHRWEKNDSDRYYQVMIQKNLFLQWEVVKAWGKKNTSFGQVRIEPCETIEQAKSVVASIAKKRRQRGYAKVI